MDMKLGQNLEQKQILSMSQVQSLNLLAMNNVEIKEFVEKEQLENPLIEITDGKERYDNMISIGNWMEVTRRRVDRSYSSSDESDQTRFDIPAMTKDIFIDHLKAQIDFGSLSKVESTTVEYLLQSFNTMGFITLSTEEIAQACNTTVETADQCVKVIRSLEPIGIGAANLEECLSIQLQAKGYQDQALYQMVAEHLVDISKGKYNTMSKKLNLSVVQVKEYIKLIKSLNPRPMNGFDEAVTEYIVPDLIFRKDDDKWDIILNDNWMGSIGISTVYQNMMAKQEDPEALAYYNEKLRRAQFILKCIEQRRSTILAISEYVLVYQSDFFEGIGQLKTLTLKQVAKALHIHESTVSRAIKEKYVQCPRGSYIFKSFFETGSRSGSNQEGDQPDPSRAQAGDAIRELIDQEPKAKPYSDSKLEQLLKEQGIHISRRTVAKYRTELGIPGTYERKE